MFERSSGMIRAVLLPLLFATSPILSQSLPGWPAEVSLIQVTSSLDHTPQPSLTWSPTDDETRPLLVGLHTWSGDYTQATNGATYARWCMERGWHFVFPNFRGANQTPAALGSDLAVQDIVDAVEHLKKTKHINASRIYLIGVSGGGHMAMLMAGRHPEIWAGVSAWCGIGDVAAWHAEHLKDGKPDRYAQNIEAALGGPPSGSKERLADAQKRSPHTWLAAAGGVPLDICHGIHDGRNGSVEFRHSLLAYNLAASVKLDPAGIAAYYDTQQRPAGWPEPEADALYGSKPVRFRATSGNTRVTIFEGGHEILYAPGLNWLAQQQKGRPAVWKVEKPLPVPAGDTKSGL